MAASVSILMGLSAIIGRAVLTGVSDRLGRPPAYMIDVVFLILSVVVLLVAGRISSVWVLYLYGCLMGVGFASKMSLISAVLADRFQGENFGTIYGTARVGIGVGGALGAWVAGLIFDLTGSYLVAFVGAAFADFLSLICVVLAVNRPPLVAKAPQQSLER